MAKIWLTYAWVDNEDNDVDFVAQELIAAGVTIKLDRWNIGAGKRLWEQIDEFITDAKESDAWLLYATANSLGSQACKEEFAYALDRALKSRGDTFPIIALFPSRVDDNLIPSGIRTRLYVSLTDTDWKERITAAAERRNPHISSQIVDPVFHKIYPPKAVGGEYTVEVRPRAGSWAPFVAAVPIDEKDLTEIRLGYGPAGRIPSVGMLFTPVPDHGTSHDGKFWLKFANNEATPTMSYYVHCKQLPSTLYVGVLDGTAYGIKFS